MSQASVLAVATALSPAVGDVANRQALYQDTLHELAVEDWFGAADLFTVTAQQATLDTSVLTPDPANILALIYDNRELDISNLREISAGDPFWRDAVGRPTSIVIEDLPSKTVQFYPRPELASKPPQSTTGEPLGADLATYNVVLFSTRPPLDPSAPPYYLELVIALRLLARDFLRESAYPDAEMAQYCQLMHELFKGMVKIDDQAARRG